MNTRDIRRKTPVTLLAASIGLVLSMPSAFAQDAAATPEPAGQATELDTVVVTGYRASLELVRARTNYQNRGRFPAKTQKVACASFFSYVLSGTLPWVKDGSCG